MIQEELVEIQVTACTERGWQLARRVFGQWKPERVLFRNRELDSELRQWTGKGFAERRAIVFIGAAGIAVRSIAPFVESKLTDSPVLVMDEAGNVRGRVFLRPM